MSNTSKLSRLMKMSWTIQRAKHKTRSKALSAAWVIMLNEDVTIQYLSLRLNHNKPVKQQALNQMSLYRQ